MATRRRTTAPTIYRQRRLPRWFLLALPLGLLAALGWLALPHVKALFVDPDALYAEAQALHKSGDLGEARGRLNAALAARGNWPDAVLQKAEWALEAGDGGVAEQALDRARSQGVAAGRLTAPLAHAQWMQGQGDKALDTLNGPLADNAAKAYAQRVRAFVFLDRGNFEGAGESYENALTLTPKDAQLWYEVALFRNRMFDPLGAIEAADRVLALNPRHVRGLELRGELARVQAGPAAALPYFERGLKAAPKDKSLLQEQVATLGAAGRYTAMLAATRKLLRSDPKDRWPFYLQGVMAARAGKLDLAASLLEKGRDQMGGSPGWQMASGVVEYRRGNFNRATDHFQALLKQQPNNLKVHKLMAAALYYAGDAEGAADAIEPLIDRTDADSYTAMIAARSWESLGDLDTTVDMMNRAAQPDYREGAPIPANGMVELLAADAAKNPDDARYVIPYLRALASMNRAGEAVPKAARLRDQNPGIADAHILVGDLAALAGRDGEALRAYETARSLRLSESTLLRLYDLYLRMDRDEDALALLSEFEKANPDNLASRQLRFDRAVAAEDWPAVINYGAQIRARIGNSDPIMMAQMARGWDAVGRKDEAVAYAYSAYRLLPMSSLTSHVYGYTLMRQGQAKWSAVQILEKAAKLAPDNGFLRYHLALAYRAAGRKVDAKRAVTAALADQAMPARKEAEALLKSL